jgi:O-antigen ligase
LVLVFAMGGGSRGDIASLMILRPASLFFLIYGLWGWRFEHYARVRALMGFAAALLGLVIIHLIPLPAALWHALPGRDVAAQIDRVAGLDAQWRPMTLVPSGAWNALFALVVPVTMLVLTARLPRLKLLQLLLLLLVMGVISGLIGLLQVLGPSDSPLYFYQITNLGSSVGLFANRNHQAAFLACLFPMLATYASTGLSLPEQVQRRGWTAALIGALIVPLLLMTGSRAGLVLGVIGILSVPLIYVRPAVGRVRRKQATNAYLTYALGGSAVVGLGLLTFVLAKASVFDRLYAQDPTDDLRWQIWGPILKLSGRYFPFGSGVGSFVEVFEMDEPRTILDTTYVNHAHNDVLEVLLTAGLPALLLMSVALVLWLVASRRAFSRSSARTKDVIFARLGSVIVLMLSIASISDYPLRVPSLACFFVIAAVWLIPSAPPLALARPKQNSDGSIALPQIGS